MSLTRAEFVAGVLAAAAVPGRRSIRGDRPENPMSGDEGASVFEGRSGARHRRLSVRNIGNGLVRVTGRVSDLSLEDVDVVNAYRVLEVHGPQAALTDFTLSRIRARRLERGLSRIGGQSTRGRFEDVHADGEQQIGDPFGVGFALADEASDITYRRCTARNFWAALDPDRFRNGDGFSDERRNRRIRYLDCEAWDNTDAGFDIKSADSSVDRCTAGGNDRNFRFWSPIKVGKVTSVTPVHRGGRSRPAHVWVDGKSRPTITIERLVVRGETQVPVLLVENGPAVVVIDSHDVSVPRGTPINVGGHPDLQIVWRSGKPTAGS